MFSRITRKIQEHLGLTKSESAVILFLSLGLLLGGGVKLFHFDRTVSSYDFRDSDSFFTEASSKIDSVLAIEEDSSGSQARDQVSVTFPVDINKAGIVELTALPGIGKVTAQRIIEYRNIHGKFISTSDLMKVKGIGQKKFERIKQRVKAE